MVSPQPPRTVSGQVFWSNNTPLNVSGFTVRAFDAVSATNLVLLGQPIPLPANGTYRYPYTWQSTGGRNGPNLVVRVFNPQDTMVGQVTRQFAQTQETLNITVNVPPPPPPPANFTLACTVRNQATNATLPNVRVDATLQSGSQLLIRSGTTNADGLVLLTIEQASFVSVPAGQPIIVRFQVFQGTQSLPTSTTIPNLRAEDQKVEIFVTIPAPPRNYLVKGTVRQSNGSPLVGALVHADNVKSGSDRLGTTKTDNTGNYEIRFTLAATAENPDLAVSVYNNQGDQLALSPTRSNAQPEETIDLMVVLSESEPQFIVKGHIYQTNGLPLEGFMVQVSDRDLRAEQLLGQQTTDATGYYEITYTRAQFRRAEKANADLVLRLFTPEDRAIPAVDLTTEEGTPLETLSYAGSDGNVIRISIWFNAPPVAVVNGTVTDAQYQGLSEYERNLDELAPLLENLLRRDLLESDLQFLVGETSLPYEQIDFLRWDDRWASDYDVEPAIFYGLLRQNLSSDLRRLLSEKPSRWRTALDAALAANIIPARLSDRLDSSLERLTELAIELAFVVDPTAPNDVPLGVKLATSPLPPDVQRRVVTFVHSYDGDDVWQALQEQGDLEPADLSEIRFTLESDTLLMGHLATLQSVQQLKQSRNWQNARNLAQLTRSDWEQIADSTTLNGLPDGFQTSQTYANAIADRIEQAFPTDVFKYRLAADNEPANQDLVTFLNSNPDFDLLHTPIDTFLKNGAELGNLNDVEALPAKLKTFSRMARVTPDRDRYQLTQGLIRQGYDSSMKIAAVSQAEFIGIMTPIAGPTVAKELHETARARTDAANMHLLRIRDYVTDFIPALPSAKPTGELAEWTKLFGSLNSCQCKHCRSVHSPAAYLVDMLEFLKKTCIRKNSRGECTKNLQQVLFDFDPEIGELIGRRPDLGYLKLNCDNSNTPLPHIDLVNELLEKHVAPESTPAGWPYQTVGSTEEDKAKLRAIPAYEHAPAYEKLAEASYPWLLPFDLNHERSQVFAKHLNINLWEIRQLFNHNEQEVARFYLGLNQTLWDYVITTERNLDTLARYWGLDRITKWAAREPVPAVLKRSGLSYEDLNELLETHYLAGRGLSLDTSEDPCNIESHFLVRREGMPSNTWYLFLDRLHRFLRLRRALGWSIEKLDTLLHERGHVDITSEALTDLVRVMQLAQRLRLSEIRVAQLDDAKLAAVLRMPPAELQRYASLFNLGDLFPPISADSEIRRVNSSLLLQFLDAYDLLQKTNFDPAELLYLLSHEDLVPAVYTLTESVLDTRLQALYSALRTANPNYLEEALPPLEEALIALIQGFRSEFPEGSGQQEREIFSIAYSYIVEQFRIAIRSESINLVDSLTNIDNAVIWFSNTLDSALESEERNRRIGLFRTQYQELREGFQSSSESIEQYRRTYNFLRQYLEDVVRQHPWVRQANIEGVTSSFYEFIASEERDGIPVELRTTYIQIMETYTDRLQQFSQHLDQIEQATVEHLAAALNIPADLISSFLSPQVSLSGTTLIPAILGVITNLTTGEASSEFPAIGNFISLVRKSGTESVALPLSVSDLPEDYSDRRTSAKQLLVRLAKAARLIQELSLSSRELSIGSQLSDPLGLLIFNRLSVLSTAPHLEYSGVETWIRLKQLQSNMPRGDRDIFDFLTEAYRADATIATIVNLISTQTGWNQDPRAGESVDTIEPLQNALGDLTVSAFQQIRTYEKLNQAIRWMYKEKFTPLETITLGTGNLANIATTLVVRAEAKYGDDVLNWYKALTPINDQLRERKRDALIAYLLANPLMIRRPVSRPDEEPAWHDVNGLYAYFLIDVEMSACQMTSRIVQAHSAIQLFVQRCRMNLEQPEVLLGTNVTDSDHWKQWQWMKNYRVWEAARKVFLYPENWIEPDLRDNKSPFFEDLENELLQDEINEATVKRSFSSYLRKLYEVAQLEVRALYHDQRYEEPQTLLLFPKITHDQLHIFARSINTPHIYYYRNRNMKTGLWRSWEKLDLNIEGDHLIPLVYNGRLMLFWATFREKDAFWELNIQWSEYHDSGWKVPQSSTSANLALELRDVDDREQTTTGFDKRSFSFRTSIENDRLYIHLFVASIFNERRTISNPDPVNETGTSYSLATFYFDECAQTLALVEQSDVICLSEHPPNAYLQNSVFGSISWNPGILLGVRNRNEDEISIEGKLSYESEDSTVPTLTYRAYRNKIKPSLGSLELRLDSYHAQLFLTTFNAGITVVNHTRHITADYAFTFFTGNKTFLVTPKIQLVLTRAPNYDEFSTTDRWLLAREKRFYFELLYHPYACLLIEQFSRASINGLLAPSPLAPLDRQYSTWSGLTPAAAPSPLAGLGPTEQVTRPLPLETVDFESSGAYSIYNWELFFHIPLLVADRLTKNQRFEDAQRWFHYIFDPTDVSVYPSPQKFWQIKPFFEEAGKWSESTETLEDMMRRLATGAEDIQKQVEVWRNDPFNPHLIARLRLVAYMKTVVQKYLENCIAWGDYLFQQDTRESINEAVQLYILAAEILGPRPVTISRNEGTARTYSELEPGLDAFANVLVDIDTSLPAIPLSTPAKLGTEIPPNLVLYFCIPSNEKLLGYWDTVSDRLFKIRNCMDIEGRVRQLPLFAPPIDPALLVRARAAGLDLGAVISGTLDLRLPHYRYQVLIQKAMEFCSEVRALGGALLSALEKKDAEDLGLLRSRHEISMLKLITLVKQQQIDEAKETLEGLRASRKLAEARLEFYSSREFMSAAETSQIVNLSLAHGNESIGQALNFAASIAHAIPDTTVGLGAGVTYGGTYIGHSLRATGAVFSFIASQHSFAANMSSIIGGYERRQDEWNLQADLAQKELDQIDKQILAAEIRLAIAEQDRRNHEIQIEQAEEMERFLKSKFTNSQLYSWMVAQLSALHYQAYRMAFDIAKKAEKAAQFELGLDSSTFNYIQFGHWDSQKKGLLAGEHLHQDLRRLELAYLDRNKRELELTKHISLISLNPLALIALKETGTCEIELPEILFDLDYPGHYMRRIKSVSITIPCVTGSYTNVNCTLTLLSNKTRIANTVSGDRPDDYRENSDAEGGDSRFVNNFTSRQSVATSTAQNDSGLFELNFRDERYLPFEGAGAISRWKVELAGNEFPQFDFNTISDVVLHLRYTARDGGARLKQAAIAYLQEQIDAAQVTGSVRLFSLRHEFPTEWARFKSVKIEGATQTAPLVLNLRVEHYPFWSRGRLEAVKRVNFFAKTSKDMVEISSNADGTGSTDTLDDALGNLKVGELTNITLPAPIGQFTLHFNDNSMEDLWLALTWGRAEPTGRGAIAPPTTPITR